jgi:hypothetical protein
MFSKFLAATFLAVLLSVVAFADGGFYGNVSYTGEDCDCTMGDKVAITPTSGGDTLYFWIDHLHASHEYTTAPTTFASGNYKLWVVLANGSKCYGSDIEIVSHGSSNQQVNLTVHGAEGGDQ